MKLFKKIIALSLSLMLLAAMCLSMASCEKKNYTIGICQLVDHPALDAATEGFKQALIDKLGEENVKFNYQNAANDSNACATIVNDFVSKNVDLILANATPALQAAANATRTIPVLGTSITDFGVALDIDNFDGKVVGGNISGTADVAPLDEQAQMIIDLFPNANKIGLLYCSGEPNSVYQVNTVKKYLEEHGKECAVYTFSDTNDIVSVVTGAADKSDVIYIPTDNTAASCAETINSVCLPKKVPVFAGEEGICKGCGTFTYSISYYGIGYQAGVMAAEILQGKADISTMEVGYDKNPVKKYNAAICEALGLTIPEGYVAIEG